MERKILFRITISILSVLVYQFKIPNDFYDLLAGLLILILLIFDLKRKNYPKDFKNAFFYYLSWLIISLSIYPVKELSFGLYSYIILILIIKLFTLIIYIIKYKSICVTKTLLSNIWLVSLALYCIEMCTNSTHGFASNCYELSFYSSIELIILAFIEKDRQVYKSSVFNFLWLKK